MEPGDKVEVPHRRDRRKKSPGVSASIGGEKRDQIRRDRRIKSPGVSTALPALSQTMQKSSVLGDTVLKVAMK